MIWHDLQSCIDASRDVKDPTALRALLAQICDILGFDDYAIVHHVSLVGCDPMLGHMRRGEKIAAASYDEAWKEKYVNEDLIFIDPVVLASQVTVAGFRWNDIPQLIKLSSLNREVLEFARRANIHDGYTVPVNAVGEASGSCHFAVRRGHELPETNLPVAQWLASVAFESARTLLHARWSRGEGAPPEKLTDRQLECIVLTGRGLRDVEVAKRLGIAPETVKRHLQEARRTMRVGKSIQLVVRALQTGQITIADVAAEEPSQR